MIVMFLSAEMMLQGVSVSLVAWGRFHNDWGGQMLVIFIITVAACEAAIALALVLMLFHAPRQARHRRLAAICARPTSRRIVDQRRRRARRPSRSRSWPHLPPAGSRAASTICEEDHAPQPRCKSDRLTRDR